MCPCLVACWDHTLQITPCTELFFLSGVSGSHPSCQLLPFLIGFLMTVEMGDGLTTFCPTHQKPSFIIYIVDHPTKIPYLSSCYNSKNTDSLFLELLSFLFVILKCSFLSKGLILLSPVWFCFISSHRLLWFRTAVWKAAAGTPPGPSSLQSAPVLNICSTSLLGLRVCPVRITWVVSDVSLVLPKKS